MILTSLSACRKLAFVALLCCLTLASLRPSYANGNNSGTGKAAENKSSVSSLRGIDVSRWQLEVDWPLVKENDVAFAFVKATQADFRLDPYFARNWEETKRVGIKRGAYHFFIPDAPIQGQIELFRNTVHLEPGDLPPVLDIEVASAHVSGEQMRKDIRQWLEAIHLHYGIKPIIYTNQQYYRRWLEGYFPDYHFWLARYSPVAPETHSGDKWMFWQYTDSGSVSGINVAVDLNFFSGGWEALGQLCVPELMAAEELSPLQQLRHLQPLP